MWGAPYGTTNWADLRTGADLIPRRGLRRPGSRCRPALPRSALLPGLERAEGVLERSGRAIGTQQVTPSLHDVYLALKAVNPAIQVGGPYVVLANTPKPGAAGLSGPWGSVDSRALAVLIYWLTHAVGADFVAVDADSEPSEGPAPVDPFRALGKFAAVDDWLTARTSLPIWWSEFYVQPGSTSWTTQHLDAVLTAALGLMDRSGASVALLWGPEQDGQGGPLGYLWTSCAQTGGGRPTPLAASLEALNRLHQSPSGGSIEVNESDRPAAWAGRRLAPYQVVCAKQ